MAETSGPWAGDTFSEDEWRSLFAPSLYDAVLLDDDQGPRDSLVATFSVSNRDVAMSAGKARVRGHLYRSDAEIIINVPEPSVSTQRIDYIALRLDPTEVILSDRIKMVLIQGQEAAGPSSPALTRDVGGVWEWPLYRIGPYGAGPIAGAPTQLMGTVAEPITVSFSGHNERIPGLPTTSNAMVIDSAGRLWRYSESQGQYNRLGDSQIGTISVPSGWSTGSGESIPRWWVKDGLVHLAGTIERTGGTFQLPTGVPGTKFTNTLPSAIRPGRKMTLAAAAANVAPSSGSSAHRQSSVLFYYDGDNRLGIMDGIHSSQGEQWIRPGSVIYLHTISWVII